MAKSANNTHPAKLPALNVPRDLDNQLRTLLESVKERLEVREGQRGNPYERVLTLRDLEQFQATTQATTIAASDNVAGITESRVQELVANALSLEVNTLRAAISNLERSNPQSGLGATDTSSPEDARSKLPIAFGVGDVVTSGKGYFAGNTPGNTTVNLSGTIYPVRYSTWSQAVSNVAADVLRVGALGFANASIAFKNVGVLGKGTGATKGIGVVGDGEWFGGYFISTGEAAVWAVHAGTGVAIRCQGKLTVTGTTTFTGSNNPNLTTSVMTKGASDPNFTLGFRNGSGSTGSSEHAALSFDYAGAKIGGIGFHRGGLANAEAITIDLSGTTRGRFADTGLTVTGTLSATGAVTANTNVNGVAFSAPMVYSSSQEQQYRAVATNGPELYGGAFVGGLNSGGVPYAAIRIFNGIATGVNIATASPTGLAVTGALSATGDISSVGGNALLSDGASVVWGAGAPTYIQGNQAAGYIVHVVNGVQRALFTGTGLAVTGALSASGAVTALSVTASSGFGCNGRTAQAAYSLGAAATDLASVITLANNLRAMAINNGIGL